MRTSTFLAALAFPALALAAPAPASLDAAAAKAGIQASLDRSYPHLFAVYKDIHQHPEVGFQEVRTAAVLAKEMRKLGFQVTERVGKTGIVAVLRNGEGPTVMVRTELDALPMEEKTGLPYASRAKQVVNGSETFVDHSCGHDAHMAWWLGAAQALVDMKDQWRGTLVFVGQPAEEVLGGADAMIADGLFARFPKPDYGFAAHVSPMGAGLVILKDGTVTSAADAVKVVFHGRGAHGAAPNASIDPIVMGAHFVSDVQTVISRERDPNAFAVITVGSFHAGSVANIIPDTAELQLTLRSFSPSVRKQLRDGVSRTAKAVADMAGAPAPDIETLNGTGAMRNDGALARRVAPSIQAAFGDKVKFAPATEPGAPASEDFAAFAEAGVPLVYLWIGGTDPKVLAEAKAKGVPVPINHSPFFAPSPEPTIRAGALALAISVLTVTQPTPVTASTGSP